MGDPEPESSWGAPGSNWPEEVGLGQVWPHPGGLLQTLRFLPLFLWPFLCRWPSLLPLTPHPLGPHRAPERGPRGQLRARFDAASLSLVLKELVWQLPLTALDILGVLTASPCQGTGLTMGVGSASAGRASDLWPGRGLEESQAERRERKT